MSLDELDVSLIVCMQNEWIVIVKFLANYCEFLIILYHKHIFNPKLVSLILKIKKFSICKISKARHKCQHFSVLELI